MVLTSIDDVSANALDNTAFAATTWSNAYLEVRQPRFGCLSLSIIRVTISIEDSVNVVYQQIFHRIVEYGQGKSDVL